jgi:Protein of unknown function (DUF5674)
VRGRGGRLSAQHRTLRDGDNFVDKPITREQIKAATWPYYEEVVKVVVDIEKRIMAIGGEMHADEEKVLLEHGSKQQDLWGLNILTELEGPDMIQFDSMINIKPWSGNRSRGVEDPTIQQRIIDLVASLIQG